MSWILAKKKYVDACLDLPLSEADFVVMDTELTGLGEKDSIVSLGAVRMRGGRIDIGHSFSRLVNPRTAISEKSIMIHEILPSDVEQMPAIDDVLEEFLSFCGRAIIVGHCVGIDITYLSRDLMRHCGKAFSNMAVDTAFVQAWLGRRLPDDKCFAGYRSSKLYDLARCLGISTEGAHSALSDAFITAQVFQRMMPLLMMNGVRTVGALLDIAHPFSSSDMYRASEDVFNL